MPKRLKWFKIVIGFSSFFLLTGCVETNQLERLGLITALGFDLEKENQIKGTVIVGKYDPLARNVNKLISADANTLQTLRTEENLATDKKLVMGQLRCVIYSKELAKKGIIQLVDALNRDPSVGNMVYLTVAEDDAYSVVNLDEKKIKVSIGTYLYNLIRQNVESELLISPTLHEFNHAYHDFGQDPVLPIIKVANDNASISGVALFNRDRMVTKLSNDKLFYLKLLVDRFKTGTKELEFSRDEFKEIIKPNETQTNRDVYNKIFISIDNIYSHTKIKLVDNKNVRFRVDINLKSRLLETTEPIDFADPKNVKIIEKLISKQMKNEVKNLLTFLQEKQVDPVGFGNEYMAKVRGKPIENKKWKPIFKNATFEVHVTNMIVKTGTMD